ncbi:hypothetical protein M407DRAFT_30354 [Tulasnella calospora MUT 4182]|uniref:Protein kinase domain-containing protein n=1 Tax=Tulasnella calospora MUT 4182 TaxID=1051891 RepID=A0A0C3Q7H9_9AGAM|nr:hypothetical protein M407DRAFT_30354 [Tulasnella calospora MUT 4182]
MTTALEKYRKLVMGSIVPYDPKTRNTSTTPIPYSPSPPWPAAQIRYIRMDYRSTIPRDLCNALEMYIDGLERESFDLDANELARQSGYIHRVLRRSEMDVLFDIASAHDMFAGTVFPTVRALAQLLGVKVSYETGPTFPNTATSRVLMVNGQPAVLVEHFSPGSAHVAFPEAIELGRQESLLDLRSPATGGPAIISKLYLAILSMGLEYGVIHSGDCFVIFQVVQESNGGVSRCLISDTIKLSDSTTPIIQIILSLALRAQADGVALPRLGSGIVALVDKWSTRATSAEGDSADNGVAGKSDADFGSSPEYPRHNAGCWPLEVMDEPALMKVLETVGYLPVSWSLFPYSEDTLYPARQANSSVWATSSQKSSISGVAKRSSQSTPYVQDLANIALPLTFRMNSHVGKGSSGWVFGGHIAGLPNTPFVAKFLRVELMEKELLIWRKLRDLAGIKIPGLFGAYIFNESSEGNQRAILLQQDAGHALESFNLLDQKQK